MRASAILLALLSWNSFSLAALPVCENWAIYRGGFMIVNPSDGLPVWNLSGLIEYIGYGPDADKLVPHSCRIVLAKVAEAESQAALAREIHTCNQAKAGGDKTGIKRCERQAGYLARQEELLEEFRSALNNAVTGVERSTGIGFPDTKFGKKVIERIEKGSPFYGVNCDLVPNWCRAGPPPSSTGAKTKPSSEVTNCKVIADLHGEIGDLETTVGALKKEYPAVPACADPQGVVRMASYGFKPTENTENFFATNATDFLNKEQIRETFQRVKETGLKLGFLRLLTAPDPRSEISKALESCPAIQESPWFTSREWAEIPKDAISTPPIDAKTASRVQNAMSELCQRDISDPAQFSEFVQDPSFTKLHLTTVDASSQDRGDEAARICMLKEYYRKVEGENTHVILLTAQFGAGLASVALTSGALALAAYIEAQSLGSGTLPAAVVAGAGWATSAGIATTVDGIVNYRVLVTPKLEQYERALAQKEILGEDAVLHAKEQLEHAQNEFLIYTAFSFTINMLTGGVGTGLKLIGLKGGSILGRELESSLPALLQTYEKEGAEGLALHWAKIQKGLHVPGTNMTFEWNAVATFLKDMAKNPKQFQWLIERELKLRGAAPELIEKFTGILQAMAKGTEMATVETALKTEAKIAATQVEAKVDSEGVKRIADEAAGVLPGKAKVRDTRVTPQLSISKTATGSNTVLAGAETFQRGDFVHVGTSDGKKLMGKIRAIAQAIEVNNGAPVIELELRDGSFRTLQLADIQAIDGLTAREALDTISAVTLKELEKRYPQELADLRKAVGVLDEGTAVTFVIAAEERLGVDRAKGCMREALRSVAEGTCELPVQCK